ncbi:MAG: polymer-forming cytoskeletal protein [Flavobacteriaceae bacterium]|jgi:cytoskeletal protein CcmA (bactofilin family)|nr:polymer-forming cytoskeletal protein [Flavobacteriaceae bacterium]
MFHKNRNKEKQEIVPDNITTVIDVNCIIEGKLSGKGYIKIDGKVLDSVTGDGIVLGQEGFIKGDTKAKEIVVYGKIEGNIFADKLILKSTAVIKGNIQAQSFQMENGAKYKGSVDMKTNFEDSPAEKHAGKK